MNTQQLTNKYYNILSEKREVDIERVEALAGGDKASQIRSLASAEFQNLPINTRTSTITREKALARNLAKAELATARKNKDRAAIDKYSAAYKALEQGSMNLQPVERRPTGGGMRDAGGGYVNPNSAEGRLMDSGTINADGSMNVDNQRDEFGPKNFATALADARKNTKDLEREMRGLEASNPPATGRPYRAPVNGGTPTPTTRDTQSSTPSSMETREGRLSAADELMARIKAKAQPIGSSIPTFDINKPIGFGMPQKSPVPLGSSIPTFDINKPIGFGMPQKSPVSQNMFAAAKREAAAQVASGQGAYSPTDTGSAQRGTKPDIAAGHDSVLGGFGKRPSSAGKPIQNQKMIPPSVDPIMSPQTPMPYGDDPEAAAAYERNAEATQYDKRKNQFAAYERNRKNQFARNQMRTRNKPY